jgi:hypothetical protein
VDAPTSLGCGGLPLPLLAALASLGLAEGSAPAPPREGADGNATASMGTEETNTASGAIALAPPNAARPALSAGDGSLAALAAGLSAGVAPPRRRWIFRTDVGESVEMPLAEGAPSAADADGPAPRAAAEGTAGASRAAPRRTVHLWLVDGRPCREWARPPRFLALLREAQRASLLEGAPGGASR